MNRDGPHLKVISLFHPKISQDKHKLRRSFTVTYVSPSICASTHTTAATTVWS